MAQGIDIFRQHQVIRSPKSPTDKTTIVSAMPKVLHETNVTIFPGIFNIPPAKDGDIEILVVGASSWFKQTRADEPSIEVIVPSIEVARSVVEDYVNSIMGVTEGAKPALFYVPGEFTKVEVKTKFDKEIKEALAKQHQWFLNMIEIADTLWVATGGKPNAISADSRMAAEKLNLQKEWMKDIRAAELVRCTACGSLVNPEYPVCPTCKAIRDPEKAKKLGLSFAQ
jgi:hypothetical protein